MSENSAEEKAIQRLRDLNDPDQWVDASPSEEVDLEDLDQKIRESGYLSGEMVFLGPEKFTKELKKFIKDSDHEQTRTN